MNIISLVILKQQFWFSLLISQMQTLETEVRAQMDHLFFKPRHVTL